MQVCEKGLSIEIASTKWIHDNQSHNALRVLFRHLIFKLRIRPSFLSLFVVCVLQLLIWYLHSKGKYVAQIKQMFESIFSVMATLHYIRISTPHDCVPD